MHSIQSHVLRCTLTCEDLWSSKMCLFHLQTSTPHKLTAVADTHTEHSQPPHAHVNSRTCRRTVLYYTVVPLHTRRNILKRNKILYFYTSKMFKWYLDQGQTKLISLLTITTQEISTATTTKLLLPLPPPPPPPLPLLLLLLNFLGTWTFCFLTHWGWHPGAKICSSWYLIWSLFCDMFYCF